MSFPSVCRVCLSRDKQMKIIANTQLQTIFEKLTSNELITSDGRPESVCYLCHLQLQKCWKFAEMSRRADMFLSGFLASGVQPTQKNLINNCAVLRLDTTPALSYTFKTLISIPHVDNDVNHEEKKSIKIEPEDRKYIVVSIDPESTATEEFQENENKETNTLNQESSDVDKEDYFVPNPVTIKDTKDTNPDTEMLKIFINESKSTKKNQPTFKCNTCPKIFRQKGYLKRHLRTHTGEKPYKCNVCEDAFTDSVILKQHIRRAHSGEAHICHICAKTFNQKPHLIEHIRTHTGEKPHACGQCSYTFAHKGSLKRHMRTHSGEKPYMCNKCSKRFTQLSNLRKHYRTCNIEKKHVCVKCLQ